MKKSECAQDTVTILVSMLAIVFSVVSVYGMPRDSVRRENLGSNVNSRYDEISPVVTADGKTIYFSRRDCPTNIGDSTRDDIYVSTFSDTGWTRAVNIGSPLNTDDKNDVAAVTSDGTTLLLYNIYNLDGSLEPGFSMAHKSGVSWSVPQKILIHGFARYDRSPSIEATLSSDGSVILLALTNNSSMGNKDLFVSFLLDRDLEEWSAPLNLGLTINSPYAELSPFLAADGSTLYFASTRPGGAGEADMYVAHRLDSTWLEWTKPENLGPSINTPGFDAFYSIPAKGDYAYFVSGGKGGYGKLDIYRIALPGSVRPTTVVLVRGRVTDEKGEGIAAHIRMQEEGTHHTRSTIESTSDGSFSFSLPVGSSYHILISKEGYIPEEKILDERGESSYQEQELQIHLTRSESVGEKNIILFSTNTSAIDEEYATLLEGIVHFLKDHPDAEVEITGYTDNVGSAISNDELSVARASAVAKELLRLGINPDRFSVEGQGAREPVARNNTERGRAQNRRVEIIIVTP